MLGNNNINFLQPGETPTTALLAGTAGVASGVG